MPERFLRKRPLPGVKNQIVRGQARKFLVFRREFRFAKQSFDIRGKEITGNRKFSAAETFKDIGGGDSKIEFHGRAFRDPGDPVSGICFEFQASSGIKSRYAERPGSDTTVAPISRNLAGSFRNNCCGRISQERRKERQSLFQLNDKFQRRNNPESLEFPRLIIQQFCCAANRRQQEPAQRILV